MDFGYPETPSASGGHVCAICFGPRERSAVLVPYLSAGLAAGAKCLCVVETSDQPDMVAALTDSIEIEGCIASGQLELFGAAQSYLRGGSFSADDMTEFWEERVESALGQARFPLTRIAAVTAGMVQAAHDLSDVAIYESELNRLATRYAVSILCLYDIELVGGGIVAALVRTHPTLVVGGLGIENPHSLGPDEYLTTLLERRHGWTALSDSERRLAELLAQGLTASEAGQRLSLDRPTLDRHLHRLFRKLQVTSREDLVCVVRERRGRQ